MASFQKRGKTWQYTISHIVNGKPKPIRKGGFRTKKEAQIAAAEVEAKLKKGILLELKEIAFAEYFKDWLYLYKKNLNRTTFRRYLNTLETIENYFGNKPIQHINKRLYQEFLSNYSETHAKSTTRKLNSHIRSCVMEAIDEGIIAKDFTRGAIISGKIESKKPEDKHLNYEESKILLKALYERLDEGLIYYLLLLALTSGMRFGEIVGLTRKDFDFKNNRIHVNKQWDYKNGSGFIPVKNEKSNRKIFMDEKTMAVFKKLFDSTPDNIHRLVFFNPYSKYKTFSNSYANKVLKNLLKELKLKQISVHGLRHTHASIALYKRNSIYYVSERLGHSDIETTHKYYAHVVEELRKQDEENLTNIFKNMFV